MELLKGAFLKSAEHYDALGSQGRPYTWMLTFAALEPGDVFTVRELGKRPEHSHRKGSTKLRRR